MADNGYLWIVVAATWITTIDGFDAFSLSLAAPHIAAEFRLEMSIIGLLFTGTMGGMIAGAALGGLIADRFGLLRVLTGSLCCVGLASLLLPLTSTLPMMLLNRIIAGIGLGAAAPLAIALLNGAATRPPSAMCVNTVWSGIGLGGLLAALFNGLLLAHAGWRSIFVVGGILPFTAAGLSYVIFRGRERRPMSSLSSTRSNLRRLLSGGGKVRLFAAASLFLFGYMTAALIMNWLPTLLVAGHASNGLISGAFAGASIGGFVGTVIFGALTTATGSRWILAALWFAVSASVLVAYLTGSSIGIAWFAVIGVSLSAGAQGLSVALANQIQRDVGLETTLLGFCLAAGRFGQFCVMGLSGALLQFGMRPIGILCLAAASAAIAGCFAIFLRPQRELMSDKIIGQRSARVVQDTIHAMRVRGRIR